MSGMNSEVYAALVYAGADEDKAREAAKSVARHDVDIAEMKASLLLIKWMVAFSLAFSTAILWRVFQAPLTGTPPAARAAPPPSFRRGRYGGGAPRPSLRRARPAARYMTMYTIRRYTTADPGGMQMKLMPVSPRRPISWAMRMVS